MEALAEDDVPLMRVMALHALGYCERLFYLEEVEEIRVADDRVYAGRTLHETQVDQDGDWSSVQLESQRWGLKGKVDYVRYRDGKLVAFEHKKGRSRGDEAWESDRLQLIAYCVLLEEHLGKPISEGRIRYHANNKTVILSIGEAELERLTGAVARGRALAQSLQRPPVCANENLCVRCSLTPVCLPEEERFLSHGENENADAVRLFPAEDERRTIHITEPGTRLGRSGHEIVVTPKDSDPVRLPGRDVGTLVLHGNVQMSTQLLHYAIANDIGVHWLSGGGRYVGSVAPPGGVQRRLRQYRALTETTLRTRLARSIAQCKVENQVRLLLRVARNRNCRTEVEPAVTAMRGEIRAIAVCDNPDTLRGHEGQAGRRYFGALPRLLDPECKAMVFCGRNRRPPQDGFNAALSFGYGLLYRDIVAAINVVGLDAALGCFHQPRTAAWPLALDLMELFRAVVWDLSLIASVNRKQWRDEHFVRGGNQVWLSDRGRKLAIDLYENRKQEEWRHPMLGYSMSYARAMELEVRLLEKEWSGKPGLFGKMRLR